MGHRMNLAVVTPTGVELKYSHWNAITLDTDLFWGPTYALGFARSLTPTEHFADEVFAEGGAVIDYVKQNLLLFGGEDLKFEIPLRRVYLKMLSANWAGWTVRWALEGVGDLADALGISRDDFRSDGGEDILQSFDLLERDTWATCIVTHTTLRGVNVFPLCSDQLLFSIRVLDSLGRMKSRPTFQFSEFPWSGIHVDETDRKLSYWSADARMDRATRLSSLWPGWTIHNHRDEYEWQFSLLGDRVQIPKQTDVELVERLRRRLLAPTGTSLAERMQTLVEQLQQSGTEVTNVNPEALKHVQVKPAPEEAERLFANAARAVPG